MTNSSVHKEYIQYFDLKKIIIKIERYLPNFNKDLFIKAFEFAEMAHKGQMRKDALTPYIVHPVQTVAILTMIHADQETLISALLHDVPEDTSYPIDKISELFGEEVSFLVDGITKLSKVHYQYNMPERQIESLKKLFLHSAKDPRVILIKLADRLHNMRTLKNIDPEKRMRIARETLEIYVPIANLLGLRDLKSRLESWCFRFLFPSEYFKLKRRLTSFDAQHEKLFERLIKLTKKYLEENQLTARVEGRQKSLYSIYKKICSQGKTIEDIDDRIGIRIVVSSIPQCYQALGIVHGHFVPKPQRFKDYIANPKPNGYQSLHTTVFGLEGVVTEIQIRTQQMHLEAEYGIAAHFFYKENQNEVTLDNLFLAKDRRSLWAKKILEMERLKKQNSEDFLEDLKLDIFQDRIFIFTPKGATIDMPKDATAIDFAYAIHTEIGAHAEKAEINKELKPITTTLKTGDVVKIVTSTNTSPELFWLSFAKTNLARNKIRLYLKQINRKKKFKDGRRLLQKEFDILALGPVEDWNFKKIRAILTKSLGQTFHHINELLKSIGEGDIKAESVARSIQKNRESRGMGGKSLLKRFWKRIDPSGITVNIAILTNMKIGTLGEIMKVLYKYCNEITYIRGSALISKHFDKYLITVIVDDMRKISKIFDELEQNPDVINVYRVLYKRFFYFYTLFIVLLWPLYPFVLFLLSEKGILEKETFLYKSIMYIAFFGLIIVILSLTHTMKKHFPVARNKKRIWLGAVLILTLAVASHVTELIYFEFDTSWIFIFVSILVMYVYLGMSYLKLRKFEKGIEGSDSD